MIYLELFLSFALIGVLGFGGGYSVIPLILEQCVNRHQWLTMAEFSDLITLSEIVPGPVSINSATFVGTKMGGIFGAIAATFGFVFVPFIITSIFFIIYKKYRAMPFMKSILSCLRPAVCALIAAAGFSIMLLSLFGESGPVDVVKSIVSAVLMLGSFIILRLKKPNPIFIILGCGAAGVVLEGVSSLFGA